MLPLQIRKGQIKIKTENAVYRVIILIQAKNISEDSERIGNTNPEIWNGEPHEALQ